ncbi:MAG: radical SAM protein [Myxococcales bacterium]|nr:radical SAM protein [Myxococcales bacterium]
MTWIAPPRPDEGVISWNINTACNYRCSYCTQRFKEDRGRWAADTPRFLAAFGRLPGRWEVKLSGGEPFVHPTLTEIVSGLAALGHRISVVTNFSAPATKLDAFVRAAQGRIGVFSASLHLEYAIDIEGFIARLDLLQSAIHAAHDASLPAPSVCVTCVATRANLPKLQALRDRFEDAGLTFKVQPEKQDRDVIPYTTLERAAIETLGGHNLTGEVAHDFHGRPCWAGARYFILDDLGAAWRCYPARRYRTEALGSFLDEGFTLGESASPCQYRYCNCTVPIARGMMSQ